MSEVKIESDTNPGQFVLVKLNGDNVTIQWLCGGQYTFSKLGLATALKNFESVNKVPDMFYADRADHGARQKFVAQLVQDTFAADESVFERASGIPWSKFRAAIVDATKE